jgi:hypothetical protein
VLFLKRKSLESLPLINQQGESFGSLLNSQEVKIINYKEQAQPYDASKTYKHRELCLDENGTMYGASCSGRAMQGIAPDSENIGHWWLAEETLEEAEARYAADIMELEPALSRSRRIEL